MMCSIRHHLVNKLAAEASGNPWGRAFAAAKLDCRFPGDPPEAGKPLCRPTDSLLSASPLDLVPQGPTES